MINTGVIQTTTVKREAMANSRRADIMLGKNCKPEGQPGPCKPYLAFSIDNILRRKEETSRNITCVVNGNKAYTARSEFEDLQESSKRGMEDSTKITHLPWLAYTRYSPPKLPSECYLRIYFFLEKRIDTNAVLCFGKWRRRRRVTKWFTSFGHVADYKSDGNIHLSPDS